MRIGLNAPVAVGEELLEVLESGGTTVRHRHPGFGRRSRPPPGSQRTRPSSRFQHGVDRRLSRAAGRPLGPARRPSPATGVTPGAATCSERTSGGGGGP